MDEDIGYIMNWYEIIENEAVRALGRLSNDKKLAEFWFVYKQNLNSILGTLKILKT